MRVNRNDADAEAIGSTVRSGNKALVDVIPLAVCRQTPIEHRYNRISDSPVISFSMVRFDTNMIRGDGAEMNLRRNLKRFANLKILAISIAHLNIQDADFRQTFAHP